MFRPWLGHDISHQFVFHESTETGEPCLIQASIDRLTEGCYLFAETKPVN